MSSPLIALRCLLHVQLLQRVRTVRQNAPVNATVKTPLSQPLFQRNLSNAGCQKSVDVLE